MPLPQPKVPLTDICSVVFNNTLYTYSADAFQALPLEAGAEWKKLPQGEKVTGGVCVGSTPGDPSTAAFFVVGGKGPNSNYQGVQKFTYSTKKWESLTLDQPIAQDRLWHGASYINTTDSIFMYAGSQTGSKDPSTHTFTFRVSAPYNIKAYVSHAPPTINPILLQWSPSEIALIGGNTDNKQVWLFNPDRPPTEEWFDSGASLADPIAKDTSAIQAIIMRGDDGSKSLYTFDMTESPNTVKRTVLFSSQDVPVPNAVPISSRSLTPEDDSLERRTPLTVNDWPEYNGTGAPTVTRNGFAAAEDHNGMVVFAGGNEEDPLCIFDARENSWVNATAMLSRVKIFSSESESSTTLSSSTRRATVSVESSTGVITAPAVPTESTSAVPVATGGGSVTSTNTILGAVLGAIFGLAIILFGIYWCIQRRRRNHAHAEAGHARRASGFSSDEKDAVSFANDSMARSLNAPGVFRGHQQQGSHSSFSSMAILMGRVNQQKPGLSSPKRIPSNNSGHTRNSSADSTFRAFKSTISKPIPQANPTNPNLTAARPPRPDVQFQPPPMREDKGVSFAPNTPEPRSRNLTGGPPIGGDDSTRRSSGWNRYWSGGSALNMLGFGNGNNNGGNNTASRRETVESDGSHYSDRNRITQDSATVPPLQIYEPRASFSRVTTRSPTIAYHNETIKQGMRGQIETQRPGSAVSSLSGYSSGIPASVHEAWDPTEATKPWGADRAPDARYNATGPYTTPLAPPATSTKPPTYQQSPRRDDMSWLNLGDGR